MKKALILSKASLHNGPRYIREFKMLEKDYEIHVVGTTAPNNDKVLFYDYYRDIRNNFLDKVIDKIKVTIGINNQCRLSYFVKRNLIKLIHKIEPSIIIIHTPIFIPFVFDSFPNRKFKIVFNAHEFHPLEFEDNIEWVNSYGKYYQKIYKNYLHKLDLLINVSKGIAEKCVSDYNKESIVIPNAAMYSDLSPKFHENSVIKVIHHGACIRSRKIEEMIHVLGNFPDKYIFDLMLTIVDEIYYKELKDLASLYKNINFIPPVSFNEIIPFLNNYDIGFYIIPPTNFNNKYSLPNKFFEFIQARLALVIGPSIEMKEIVKNENIGIVSENFTSDSFKTIFEELSLYHINLFKTNAHKIASCYSHEKYESIYKDNLEKC